MSIRVMIVKVCAVPATKVSGVAHQIFTRDRFSGLKEADLGSVKKRLGTRRRQQDSGRSFAVDLSKRENVGVDRTCLQGEGVCSLEVCRVYLERIILGSGRGGGEPVE